MKITCVIPARLKSTRIPTKMLCTLSGKPLLQWVWEAARSTNMFDEIVFAVDDKRIEKIINGFGGVAFLTSVACQSGTDRLVELVRKNKIKGDIIVNWQGDEPFITYEMVKSLLKTIKSPFDIWTLKKEIKGAREIHCPHNVKVVTDHLGKALYFSRSPIPFVRNNKCFYKVYKHIGIYAFKRQALKTIGNLPSSYLEEVEGLEQLRFLQSGMSIQVHETTKDTIGIDTAEDMKIAEEEIFRLLGSKSDKERVKV